jgi:hypothetical protein
MGSPPASPLAAFVQRFLPRLRYPYLFLILGGLLLLDLVVPDPVPLIDELILAVLTLVTATLTTRQVTRPEPRDVTESVQQKPPMIESESAATQPED